MEDNNRRLFHLQDVKLLTQDLVELRPTIFCAVPRVLDVIYTGMIIICMIHMLNSQIIVPYTRTVDLNICTGFDHHAANN